MPVSFTATDLKCRFESKDNNHTVWSDQYTSQKSSDPIVHFYKVSPFPESLSKCLTHEMDKTSYTISSILKCERK